jgi:uncharacterized membrane protein
MDQSDFPQPPANVPPKSPVPTQSTDITDNDRLMAALAYLLWFLGSAIILLSVSMKDRPYLRYHAIQALGLSAALTIATFILFVSGVVLCLCWVLLLMPLGVTLYYTYMAYQGIYFKIPIITNLMMSEGWLKQP